jgi:hypothetical protein
MPYRNFVEKKMMNELLVKSAPKSFIFSWPLKATIFRQIVLNFIETNLEDELSKVRRCHLDKHHGLRLSNLEIILLNFKTQKGQKNKEFVLKK